MPSRSLGGDNPSGIKAALCEVKLGDFFVLLGSVLMIFSYGAPWTGLTGAQLVMVRMSIAAICIVALLFKMSRSTVPNLGRLFLAYSVLLMALGALSPVSPGNGVLQGMVAGLMFFAPAYYARKYGVEMLLRTLFWVFLFIVAIMDAFSFVTGGQGVLTRENEWVFSSNYIFGGKFTFSYTNMLFFALAANRFGNSAALVVCGAVGISGCALAECSTGIVGICVMAITIAFRHALRPMIGAKWTIPAVIVAMALIAVTAPEVMQLPIIQHLAVNFLGESADFTGRMTIYPHLIDLWMEHPLFGYGSYGAANTAVMSACNAPDAQEGLFHILLANGAAGGFLFLAICAVGLLKTKRLESRGIAMYAFLFAMAICSLVEINLGPLFLLGVTLVWLMTECDRKEERLASGQ